ncbi:MAG: hypothetical protein KDI16_02610 [Halioglobus sp.]|nr:hypothetical protein [Halioglobus sp.]
MSDIEDGEAMVRELRDTNAIHRLKAGYCALADSGYIHRLSQRPTLAI